VRRFASYILCGTPRSGSTLLCGMLAATGVAGRPNSYFREQNILDWARDWGVQPPKGPADVDFDRSYIAAMLREGSAGTGVFGLRLMWGSLGEAAERLSRIRGTPADAATLFEEAFGPTLYIHLSRLDKVSQAVSLVRAEQSGLWHISGNGTVLEGAASPQPLSYDADRIDAVLTELEADDAAWADFFATRQAEPLKLTYETVTAAPQLALAYILSALGRNPEIAKAIDAGTAKMADATSIAWVERFRKESGRRAQL
jgi:LPS sulfotransferase NodH